MPTTLRVLSSLSALAAALAVSAAPTAAAERFSVAPGRLPAVALADDGTAHIAWLGNESLNASLRYCRLPYGATACDVSAELTRTGDSVSRPFVMVSGDGGVVKIFQYRYGLRDGLTPDKFASVFMFTSGDGGGSFDDGDGVGTLPFADAALGPAIVEPPAPPVAAVSLVTQARTGGTYFQRVRADGSAVTDEVLLDKDLPYDGAVGVQDGTAFAVYADALGEKAKVQRSTGADLNTPAGWTSPQDINGRADSAHLAGGPSGMFLLATRADGNVEVRKFNGTTFGAGVTRDGWRGESPQDHLAQDAGGWLHTLLPQITANCCPLLYSYSTDGTGWTSVSYPMPALASQVRSAFLADHRGIAVWHSAGAESTIYALRLGPRVALRLPAAGSPPASARASGGNVVVKIGGRLRPPTGVPAAEVCGGRLAAGVRSASGSKLGSRRLRVSADCKFSGRLSVPKSKVGSGPVRLVLELKATRTAKATKRSYRVKLRR